MVKFLSNVYLIVILIFTSLILAGQSFSEKPTVLSHGKFVPLRKFNPNETVSENGRFRCTYGFETISEADFNLKNIALYNNNTHVATLKYASGSEVEISNSGFLTFYEHTFKEGSDVKLHFFSSGGVKLFSGSFENAVLFGFSSAGNKFGVGTPDKFEVFSLPSGNCASFPGAQQFDISNDESMVALASEGHVFVYQNDKLIGDISHDLMYIRKIRISPDNNYVAFIGKNIFFVYSLPNCKLIYSDKLEKCNSFRDLKLTNTTAWAGIHYKDRENRLSKGILKTYDLKGNVISEEIQIENKWAPLKKLNYEYKKRNKYGFQEIPWPFQPFDQPQKIWNSYLQLSSSGDGNNSGAYCHEGVDMDVPTYSKVYAVVDGYVKAVLSTGGTLYWRVAVSEEQTSDSSEAWLNAHLIENTIAVDAGDEVMQGDLLGEIIDWPGLPGGHIHFSRIKSRGTTWSGWRNSANPAFFLTPTGDDTPPEIRDVFNDSKFGFTDNNNTSDYLDADNLSGEIDILVKVRDIWGNSPWVQAGTLMYYWVRDLRNDKIVFPRTLAYWRGQGMPTYGGGLYDIICKIIWRVNSQFPVKGWFTEERLYVHVITNNDGDSIITENDDDNGFNTANYGDGNYRIIVEVQDVAGNTTIDSQDVVFNNGVTNADEVPEKLITSFAFNGVLYDKNTGSQTVYFQIPKPSKVSLEIYDLQGNKLEAITPGSFPAGRHSITWNGKSSQGKRVRSGMYLYKLKADKIVQVKKAVYCR